MNFCSASIKEPNKTVELNPNPGSGIQQFKQLSTLEGLPKPKAQRILSTEISSNPSTVQAPSQPTGQTDQLKPLPSTVQQNKLKKKLSLTLSESEPAELPTEPAGQHILPSQQSVDPHILLRQQSTASTTGHQLNKPKVLDNTNNKTDRFQTNKSSYQESKQQSKSLESLDIGESNDDVEITGKHKLLDQADSFEESKVVIKIF